MKGEDQKKLDVLANEVFINLLTKCGQCAVLVSLAGSRPCLLVLRPSQVTDCVCTVLVCLSQPAGAFARL